MVLSPQCRNRYHDIVLVVVYERAFTGWLEVHALLKKLYAPMFRQIVFTGFLLQVRPGKIKNCGFAAHS